jgi:uncharacterized protein (DUF433 family)
VTYNEWKNTRVSKDPAVLGGAAVFSGTRLSVHHIGRASEEPDILRELREDYPYLNDEDFEYARRLVSEG